MITDKEIVMLSSSNNSMLDSDLDQNITTNVTSISPVFATGNLSVEDGVNNNDLSIPITSFESSGSDLISHTTIVNQVQNSNNQVQNGNSILESLVISKDEADNGNLNHSRFISQSSNPDDDVTVSLPKKVLKKCNTVTISTSSIMKHKTLCCKIFIIFAICCIIGIFLIPIIAYYVNQTRNDAEVDTEYSHEINTSNAEVSYVNVLIVSVTSNSN